MTHNIIGDLSKVVSLVGGGTRTCAEGLDSRCFFLSMSM